MADQLIFYIYPMSRGRIVRWMLDEIGRPTAPSCSTTISTMSTASGALVM